MILKKKKLYEAFHGGKPERPRQVNEEISRRQAIAKVNVAQAKSSDIHVGLTGFISEAAAWDQAQSERAAQLPALLKEQGIKTVRVVYSDQHGLLRGKALSTENFLLALNNGVAETVANLGKDTSNFPVFPLFERDGGFGVEQMGGAGDMLLVPDPMTFKILPWASDTAWVLSDLYLKDRTRCPFDCRQLMRNALNALKELDYSYSAGLELEFHVFEIADEKLSLSKSGQPPSPPAVKAISHGFQYHAEHSMDRVAHVAGMIRDLAAGLELPLRTIETEWGPSQFEVTFNPLTGLAAADSVLLFRSAVKQLMRRHGLLASFMAKPALPNVYSSGWHLHQSLRNGKTGANAFVGAENLLSDTGYHYIGGLLEHGAALTAFSNPTINGYKRLNANPLAPNRILWARDNRGAMLRLVGGYAEPGTRIENRSGEPSANPYLYMASQMYAGLDGIRNGTHPGEPVRDDPYRQTDRPALPRSLLEAVEALAGSAVLRAGFGDRFVDHFLHIKRAEIGRFLAHVTDWEHREYFETF